MQATIEKDASDVRVVRVEAIDDDGGCEVAIFSGPRAHARAIAFANAMYDDVEDETEQ